MSTHLETLIDRIFNHLQKLGSTIPDRRRAGLDQEVAKRVMRGLGLDAPDDLLAVYAYCDGTSTHESDILAEIQFFPGYYWMSFDDVVQVYRAVTKSDDWQHPWLPVFANGGGDFYAVVCDAASPYFGEIVGFVRGEPSQIVEFRNVESLLETIERSFAQGAFFISEGKLKADYSRMRAIARQVQPEFTEHEIAVTVH